MKDIGESLSVSATTVSRVFDYVSYSCNNLPKILALDEFRGNAGGEKFQTILNNPRKKEELDILSSRKSEELYAYFSKFKNRNNVEVVDLKEFNKCVTTFTN